MKNRCFLGCVWLCIKLTVVSGLAQQLPSVEQIAIDSFLQKAQQQHWSVTQLEYLARLQGFSATDILAMRTTIAEKYPQLAQPVIVENTRKSTPTAIVAKPDSSAASSLIFGANFFRQGNISFEPNLRLPTPTNYQLGPDDELLVDIFGQALDHYTLKVSPEGTVKMLNLSPIYVNGLSVAQASSLIINRLRQLYQGLNLPKSGVSAQITLGNVRSISVTLTGEVQHPGHYTLSSLASVLHALYASGGPSDKGSFRAIELIRQGKRLAVLDIYDFLLKAMISNNLLLQDQDIIRIPDAMPQIQLVGAVKRPMIFEVKPTETLRDVLYFAGGFTAKAYTKSIQLLRNTSSERHLYNVLLQQIPDWPLQAGDQYHVGSILERIDNHVKITGSVYRPAVYAIDTNNFTLRKLIAQAEGLRPEAFVARAMLKRKNQEGIKEWIGFNLQAILQQTDADIPLQNEDEIHIFAKTDLQATPTLSIEGEVNRPNHYPFHSGMGVADAILLAGGFTDQASTQLEVARRIKSENISDSTTQVLLYTIHFDKTTWQAYPSFPLHPFDRIIVRKLPRYQIQKTVFISGEIWFTGSYTLLEQHECISDLIRKAGGIKPEAYLEGAILERAGQSVAIDLPFILKHPHSSQDLLLIHGDTLQIPQKLETVKLSGAVWNPVMLSFRQGQSLKSYLAQAGGLTADADTKRIYIKYANGFADKTRRWLFFRNYPTVMPASEIVVPHKAKPIHPPLSSSERVALVTGVGSLVYLLVSIMNVLK